MILSVGIGVLALQLVGTPPAPKARFQARPEIFNQVELRQNINAQIPLDLAFTDHTGKSVNFGDLIANGKPTVLSFAYYKCTTLCPATLNGVLKAVRTLKWDMGQDYNVVNVSVNHRELASDAADKREAFLKRYGRKGADWNFLVGTEDAVKQLAEVAGYGYSWDEKTQQYAHSSAIMVLTPEGKISRYLMGVEYSARVLRLTMVEAAAGKIGNIVDGLVLYCFKYDPASGKYTLAVFNALRIGAVLTVLGLGAYIISMLLRERQNRSRAA